MIISVASGKGGTGKTTVSASLAAVWKRPVTAVDLDVEEPNLHIFLKPDIVHEEKVYLEVPRVDESRCTLCGKCSDLCQFKAINVMGSAILTFPEMCHGCGGCLAVCPEDAVSWGTRQLGTMSRGKSGPIDFLMGSLRVGEAMSPPLMRQVKDRLKCDLARTGSDAIIDAPPGVSCPAVNAVMDSDFILLVTEPTPFGFHDFQLALEAFAPLNIPAGALINRSGIGDDSVQRFCQEQGIPVLAWIPFDTDIASAYSRGKIIADLSLEFRQKFSQLAASIIEHIGENEACPK